MRWGRLVRCCFFKSEVRGSNPPTGIVFFPLYFLFCSFVFYSSAVNYHIIVV